MLLSLFLTFFAVTSSLYAIFRWRRRRLYELADKIPGENGLPLIGAVNKFLNLQPKDYVMRILSFCKSGHKITKGWFGPLLVVLTEDPDVIHTVFNSPHTQDKPSYFYNGFYMDDGLFVCNGSQYDKHRKIFTKSFTVSMIQKFLPTFNEKSKKCVEKMSKHLGEGEFDVFDYVGTCTLESFCTKQLNYERDFYDSNFMKLLHEVRPLVMKRMFSPWYNYRPLYQLTSLCRKLDYYHGIMLQHIDKIVDANVTSPVKAIEKSVIDMLMNPDNDFNESEFRDEMVTFIFTGHEASAISLSAVLLMLAIHKDAQQKVIEEVDAIVDCADNLSNEDLTKFTYIDMVIKESLRLFGPGGIVARQTSKEMELGGYTVPKGTALVLSIYGMQRNPKIWGEDAHLFRPERFEPENIKDVHPHALAPFSGGKRICIGYKYAVMFTKVFLAHFFKAYTIDTTINYDEITVDMIPTLIISQRYMLSLKRRHN